MSADEPGRESFSSPLGITTLLNFILTVRPEFFYFLFYRFFLQQVRGGGRNKNKNKINSDHFPIELKLKETWNRVSFNFNSIGKWSE